MQAVPQSDEFTAAGINRSEQGRAFVGFGTGRAEKGFLQFAGCDLRQLFCEVHKVFGQVDIADMLQGIDLFTDPGIDLRIAVAAVDDRDAGKAVEISAPFTVEKVLHGAFDHLARFFIKVSQTRHDIFFLLLKDGLRANVI